MLCISFIGFCCWMDRPNSKRYGKFEKRDAYRRWWMYCGGDQRRITTCTVWLWNWCSKYVGANDWVRKISVWSLGFCAYNSLYYVPIRRVSTPGTWRGLWRAFQHVCMSTNRSNRWLSWLITVGIEWTVHGHHEYWNVCQGLSKCADISSLTRSRTLSKPRIASPHW